MHYSVTET